MLNKILIDAIPTSDKNNSINNSDNYYVDIISKYLYFKNNAEKIIKLLFRELEIHKGFSNMPFDNLLDYSIKFLTLADYSKTIKNGLIEIYHDSTKKLYKLHLKKGFNTSENSIILYSNRCNKIFSKIEFIIFVEQMLLCIKHFLKLKS